MNSKSICGIPVFYYALLVFTGLFMLSGCSTSLHGSFLDQSYSGHGDSEKVAKLGLAEGRSCQTRPLYLLAYGDPATTDEAIKDARSNFGETSFLADISIDDETKWSIGYSTQCIVVRATAYK